jgi:predicted dehydrogenase
MGELRIAVVGAGYFSRFQLEGWRAIDGALPVALCDLDEAKARARAQSHGIAHTYTSIERMLEDQRPDLVDIVVPPVAQRALVEAALARGIPTICQKPFGTGYAEAAAMTQAAARAGVPLIVHENFRFQPWYREARSLIDAGTLGALHAIAFRLRPGDGQGPRAYLDRQPYFQKMPRLLVVETAIHLIDTFRFLMGEVAAVTARLRRANPTIAGEDAGYVIFEFAGGAAGMFDGNRLNDHVAENTRRTMGEMWLEGTRGVLRLDGDARLWWKPHGGPEAEHAYARGDPESFGDGCCEALQRHVVAHLVDGAPVENAARDYLANLRVQEAVYVSHREGRRIALAEFSPPPVPMAVSFA